MYVWRAEWGVNLFLCCMSVLWWGIHYFSCRRGLPCPALDGPCSVALCPLAIVQHGACFWQSPFSLIVSPTWIYEFLSEGVPTYSSKVSIHYGVFQRFAKCFVQKPVEMKVHVSPLPHEKLHLTGSLEENASASGFPVCRSGRVYRWLQEKMWPVNFLAG